MDTDIASWLLFTSLVGLFFFGGVLGFAAGAFFYRALSAPQITGPVQAAYDGMEGVFPESGTTAHQAGFTNEFLDTESDKAAEEARQALANLERTIERATRQTTQAKHYSGPPHQAGAPGVSE